MSSTRRATDGEFHQERFCSAAQFERGLLANIVAKRCELLGDPKDRELAWAIQLLSHREGLQKIAARLVQRFAAQLGTASMRKFGMDRGRVYSGEEAATICKEISQAGGESSIVEAWQRAEWRRKLAGAAESARLISAAAERRAAEPLPAACSEGAADLQCNCALEKFFDVDRLTENLSRVLAQICTDPSRAVESFSPWYFPSLIECLRTYVGEWAEARRRELVTTELSRQVFESLDYLLDGGGMMVLDGPPLRVGKSFAAKTWCDMHLGRARFVAVPATNDDIGFFRAIAEALGSASALSLKGVQLRDRAEMTLQSSKLMLVLDDAHFLFPQSNRREALPNRLNWLLTALVNRGVPVAMVTTPQFARDQKIVEKKTGWTSAQFLSQIGEYKKLPQIPSRSDLTAIAKHCLPPGDSDSIKELGNYAYGSRRYLAAIEAAVRRATFLAAKDGRDHVNYSDVDSAINDYIAPSDQALKKALAQPAPPGNTEPAADVTTGRAGASRMVAFDRAAPAPQLSPAKLEVEA